MQCGCELDHSLCSVIQKKHSNHKALFLLFEKHLYLPLRYQCLSYSHIFIVSTLCSTNVLLNLSYVQLNQTMKTTTDISCHYCCQVLHRHLTRREREYFWWEAMQSFVCVIDSLKGFAKPIIYLEDRCRIILLWEQ